MAQTQIRGTTQIMPGTVPLTALVSGYAIPTANLVDGANFLKRDGTVALTGSLNAGGNAIQNVGTPVNGTDAATKAYADAIKSGFRLHFARLAATANVSTLSGLQTIDGVTASAGDIIFLPFQTNAAQNGLWAAASGSWTRPSDWAAASTLPEGQYIIVDPDGTTYKNTKWFLTNTGNVVVDTTAATFAQDQSGTTYSNGNGLSLTGTTFAVKTGNAVTFDGTSSLTITPDPNRMLQVLAAGIGIKDGTAGQILMAGSTNSASYQTLTGDVTITSAGVTTVNNTAGSGFLRYTNVVFNETPTGTINGTNATFTLATAPQVSSLQLYLNGDLLEPGAGNDYTISGTAITMLLVPQSGDKLRAYYLK